MLRLHGINQGITSAPFGFANYINDILSEYFSSMKMIEETPVTCSVVAMLKEIKMNLSYIYSIQLLSGHWITEMNEKKKNERPMN